MVEQESQESPGTQAGPASAEEVSRRRRRRWPWLVLALPVLLWATRTWVLHPILVKSTPWLAARVGLEVELDGLESDWWSGLRVRGVTARGGEALAFLLGASLEEAEVEFDLVRLIRGEAGWLESIRIVRPSVRLDLDRLPASEGEENGPILLPDALPRLELVGGEVQIDQGSNSYSVQDLGLTAGLGRDGWEAALAPTSVRLASEGAAPRSWSLAAEFEGNASELTIQSLDLDGEPLLGRSSLRPLPEGGASFELQPLGPLERGRLVGSFEPERLAFVLELAGVDLAALGKRLDLSNLAALAGEVDTDVVFDGPPAGLMSGDATIRVLARGLRHGAFTIDDLELRGGLQSGTASIEELDVRAPGNVARLEAVTVSLESLALEDLWAAARGTLTLEGQDLSALTGSPVEDLPAHTYRLGARVEAGRARLDPCTLQSTGGTARLVGAELRWDPASGNLPFLKGEAELAFDDLEPLGRALGRETAWAGRVAGDLDLEGPLDALLARAELAAEGLALEGMTLGTVEVDASWEEGRLSVSSLRADTGSSRLEASGAWSQRSRLLEEVEVRIQAVRPQEWVPALAEGGSVRLEASLHGRDVAPSGSVRLEGAELRLTGSPLREAFVDAVLEEGTLLARSVRVATSRLAVEAAGRVVLPLEGRSLDLLLSELSMQAPDGARLDLQAPAQVLQTDAGGWRIRDLDLRGSAGSAHLDVELGDQGPRIQASLAGLDPMPFVNAWEPVPWSVRGIDAELEVQVPLDVQLSGSVREVAWSTETQPLQVDLEGGIHGGRAELDSIEIRQGGARIAQLALSAALPGTPDWRTAALRIQGQVHPDPASALEAGGLVLHARGQAAIDLEGSWAQVRGSLSAEGLDLEVDGGDELAFLTGPAALAGALQFDGVEARLRDAGLSLPGRAALALEATLGGATDLTPWLEGAGRLEDLTLTSAATASLPDLGWLTPAVPSLRRLSGKAEARVQVQGSLAAPTWSGNLSVSEGAVRSPGAPPIDALDLRAAFDSQRVELESLQALVGSAPLVVEGVLQLGAEPTLQLTAKGENLLLARDASLRLRADTDLSVSGPLDGLAVEGRIGVRNSHYRSNVDLLGALDGTPRFESQQTGIHIAPFSEGPLAEMRFDVLVETVEPVEVEMNVFRGDARLGLRLEGDGRGLIPEGSVFLENGRLRLPSGRMDLTAGRIEFTKSNAFYPLLDLRGESRLLGYDTTILVSGDLGDPRVSLSSIPTLPSDQLLLLVMTGTLPSSATATKAVEALTVYVAQDFLERWFEGGSGSDSIGERIEFESGRDVSASGLVTLEAKFRAADAVVFRDDHIWIVAERDEYEDFNGGLRFSLDLR